MPNTWEDVIFAVHVGKKCRAIWWALAAMVSSCSGAWLAPVSYGHDGLHESLHARAGLSRMHGLLMGFAFCIPLPQISPWWAAGLALPVVMLTRKGSKDGEATEQASLASRCGPRCGWDVMDAARNEDCCFGAR